MLFLFNLKISICLYCMILIIVYLIKNVWNNNKKKEYNINGNFYLDVVEF